MHPRLCLLFMGMLLAGHAAVRGGEALVALQTAAALEPVVVEGEALVDTATASEGRFGRQEMAGFGPHWSGAAQLFWGTQQEGAQLRLVPSVPVGGRYEVTVVFTRAPDFGRVEASLDGGPVVAWDGYAPAVGVGTQTLGTADLAAGPHELLLRVAGKNDASSGRFVGIDRIELRPAASAAGAPLAVPPTLLRARIEVPAPWTTQDVIDGRIDVSAQYALMRMFRGEATERAIASNILSAVKSEALGGVYQEDQRVPALRAQAQGTGWWQILPKPVAGFSIDGVCMRDPGGEPPILVMRKKAEQNPAAYDRALQAAWLECELPAAPVRVYQATLPPKPQAAPKGRRCDSPADTTSLSVGVHLDRGSETLAVVGASVVIEGNGTERSTKTDGDGLAFFGQLRDGGLYLVRASGGLPALPYEVAKAVEVLPDCGNWTWLLPKDDASSCEAVLARAQTTCLATVHDANQQCNRAFTGALTTCADEDTDCEAKATAAYDGCTKVVYDELAACKKREAGTCLGG